MIDDPVQGALWSGPPFSSPIWSAATRARNPGTPEWLPDYGDGSLVRFTNQENHLDIPGATWGPMRIVYLQYASDPITFFTPDALWRKPDWMNAAARPRRLARAALVPGRDASCSSASTWRSRWRCRSATATTTRRSTISTPGSR